MVLRLFFSSRELGGVEVVSFRKYKRIVRFGVDKGFVEVGIVVVEFVFSFFFWRISFCYFLF